MLASRRGPRVARSEARRSERITPLQQTISRLATEPLPFLDYNDLQLHDELVFTVWLSAG